MRIRTPFGSRDDRRPAPTTEQAPLRERLPALALAVYVPATALLYAFQGLWRGAGTLLYALTGLAALAVCAACVWQKRLYRGADALLLLFMPVCALVSAAFNFGLSLSILTPRFFIVWAVLLSLYFALRVAPDPDRLIGLFAAASVPGLSLLCLLVLFRATGSLFSEIPGHDLSLGCFQLGRLCGLNNANIFAFSCTALLLLSAYAFLRAAGGRRMLYALSGFVGWFTLGLTNCRTGILGVSFCVGLLVLSTLRAGRGRLRAWLPAAALGAGAAALCMASLYLPPILYRGGLTLFGRLAHRPYLLNNLAALQPRGMTGGDGTASDRLLIWRRVLEDVGKTPLRTWFGVSHLNDDAIGGVYAGHHEISTPHAHNTYLEMLRRFGVVGFVLLMASVARWCAAGLRCLRSPSERIPARCLAAAAAGILLMGLPEQVPFPFSTTCSLSLPFFAICGYFMNHRRRSHEIE